MNSYKILIKFKDGKDLLIDIEADIDLRQQLFDEFPADNGRILIGDYIINAGDILWLKIDGETLKQGEITE